MPYQTSTSMTPKKNALVVCAGTVTCSTVSAMGAGFDLFKKLFSENGSCNSYPGGWQAELQGILDSKKIPPYIRVAAQNGLIGGVATVPVYPGENEQSRKQYKAAVQQAILDAKKLERPLFLQPLGIGVYGWPPEKAAVIFAEAIFETDPTDQMDITIPIYQTTAGSVDQRFKKTLAELLLGKGRPLKEYSHKPITDLNSLEKTADDKQVLLTIINSLITNIANKHNNRWTSGKDSKKVEELKKIKGLINTQENLSANTEEYETFLQDIMKICKMKRNVLHFWHTPESVQEYLNLLKENNINFTSDKKHSF